MPAGRPAFDGTFRCSAALAIRDNKNLRVRLPLNELKIIGKNISEMLDFQDVIADEVNVKNVTISDKIDEFASQKLQINFKKIGAKYGAKVKEINEAARVGNFKKIDDNAIEIAGVKLVDDEFEIKFLTNDQDEKKFAIMTLPSNDCLVLLDIEITQDLIDEGISRDIVRLIQQSRKAADLNVSDHIEILIFSPNQAILEVAKKEVRLKVIPLHSLSLSVYCIFNKLQYNPPLASSSACIPFSISCPLSITIIWWALRMVCKWWAMTKTVRFRISADIACCILYSLTGSTLLVISSNRRMGASLRKARAMERRCFCPPDSPKPFSPIFVS